MSAHTPGQMKFGSTSQTVFAADKPHADLCSVSGDTDPEVQANGAEIVRRWNAHEELLAALESVASEWPYVKHPTLMRASAAIAQARGGK